MNKLKHGVKIKNIKSGSLHEYNLGLRERFDFVNSMYSNSLLLYFLLENGLKIEGKSTRDIICIDFEYGSRSYENECKHLESLIENETNKTKLQKLNELYDKVKLNEKKYDEKTKEELREMYYKSGVKIKYEDKTIKYKMLYRSTGKAKQGSCIFINENLYEKAHNFIYMGIKLPYKNSPIVEASGYISLVASGIVGTININPKDILILKDVDSFFKTNIISVETDESKQCIAKYLEDYKLKNTMFDGQALIDSSIFPEWGNGFILLRHHMMKSAAFNSNIQLFFKDYFKDDYETAQVKDMFGNLHFAKNIKVITTDNSMKWLKFGITYEYWCDRVKENNCTFGIVKTDHKSKLGEYQKMSYQMTNVLDIDLMNDITKATKEYIESLKKDDNLFLEYLKNNSNFSNDYEVLIALCEQNYEFTRSDYFRLRKEYILRDYVKKIKTGKLIQNGDNLVIVGSPYAMLLHSVGEDVNNDITFEYDKDTIQCFTKRFKNNEYLAGFRSPLNSRNNVSYLHNHYHEYLLKYFNFSEQIIAVNMIGTDFQDRNNGLTKWVS